ncbi:hypothetical protein D4764_0101400 [Takifugu flavidus]|uniref:FISNA domain-containing protein n=1 Tax=Takifugu flavidus TaxID=433684 RepID=A0A5C6MKU8_9TELE|nr:hypothetical protein D4764_0101400 [Takifugu flavidus]
MRQTNQGKRKRSEEEGLGRLQRSLWKTLEDAGSRWGAWRDAGSTGRVAKNLSKIKHWPECIGAFYGCRVVWADWVQLQERAQVVVVELIAQEEEGCDEKVDEQRLDDVYTQLYVTTGGDIHINAQHEVTQIDMVGTLQTQNNPLVPVTCLHLQLGKINP